MIWLGIKCMGYFEQCFVAWLFGSRFDTLNRTGVKVNSGRQFLLRYSYKISLLCYGFAQSFTCLRFHRLIMRLLSIKTLINQFLTQKMDRLSGAGSCDGGTEFMTQLFPNGGDFFTAIPDDA
jgi:hypothetical protein